MTTNQVSFPLPRDVTIQIFLLLPHESILACKCVSKQWKNLINDPEFTKLYPHKFPTLVLCKDKVYCLSTRQLQDNLPSIELHRIPFSIREDYSTSKRRRNDLLQGSSSNRIACVRAANGHLLWYNLLTGDSYEVPLPTPVTETNFVFLIYGFGYDHYADDYKILLVCASQDRDILRMSTLQDTHCYSQIYVYSFRDRCWESIIGFPCAADTFYSLRSKAYSFKGALHWVMYKRDYEESILAALDLHSYRLVEMALPEEDGYFLVAELDGQLCCWSSVGHYLEVWVMKEYGVGGSWTKLLRVCLSQVYRPVCDYITPIAVYEWKDVGKLVLLVSHYPKVKLFWYDIDNDKIINIVDETARGKVRILGMLKTGFKAAIGMMGCWS